MNKEGRHICHVSRVTCRVCHFKHDSWRHLHSTWCIFEDTLEIRMLNVTNVTEEVDVE